MWAPDNSNYAYRRDGQIFVSTCCNITSDVAEHDAPNWQPVIQTHARPRGATPIRLALVPEYNACSGGNTVHKGSIASNSCNPASQSSAYLTVGTPGANGFAANAVGSVVMQVVCQGVSDTPPCLTTAGDQLDGKLTISFTDVRCSQGTSGGCGDGTFSDYQGDLLFKTNVRITDENSLGLGGATVVGLPLSVNVPCTITPPGAGSDCSEVTSLDAIFGSGRSGGAEACDLGLRRRAADGWWNRWRGFNGVRQHGVRSDRGPLFP